MQRMQVKTFNMQVNPYSNLVLVIKGSRNAGVSGTKSAEEKSGGKDLLMQGVMKPEAP
jgi:hypothetical protein